MYSVYVSTDPIVEDPTAMCVPDCAAQQHDVAVVNNTLASYGKEKVQPVKLAVIGQLVKPRLTSTYADELD